MSQTPAQETQEEVYDVVIVGAGIAGLSAAMYLARQGMKVIVVSKDLGGQLLQASIIENYPGIEAIKGLDLALRVEKQAKLFGAKTRYGEEVVQVIQENGQFIVVTKRGRRYRGDALLLTFGKMPRKMGVPGEEEHDGKGVSYCTICDGPLYKGKPVAIVGVGDQGLEGVMIMMGLSPRVYYVTPTRLFGDPGFLDAVKKAGNVEVLENHEPVEVLGDGLKVKGLKVRNKQTGEEKVLEVEGIFVELGYVAKTDFVSHLVDLNDKGEIITGKMGETRTPGVYAAGDVTDVPFKQAVISAGDAVKAALAAFNYIRRKRGLKGEVKGDWKKTGKVQAKKKAALRL